MILVSGYFSNYNVKTEVLITVLCLFFSTIVTGQIVYDRSVDELIDSLDTRIMSLSINDDTYASEVCYNSILIARLFESKAHITDAYNYLNKIDSIIKANNLTDHYRYEHLQRYLEYFCSYPFQSKTWDCDDSPPSIYSGSDSVAYYLESYLSAKHNIWSDDKLVLQRTILDLRNAYHFFIDKQDDYGLLPNIELAIATSYYFVNQDSAQHYLSKIISHLSVLPEKIDALIEFAFAASESRDYEKSIYYRQKIWEIDGILKTQQSNPGSLATEQLNLGVSYLTIGEIDLASDYIESALSYWEDFPEHRDFSTALLNKAIVLEAFEKYDMAIDVNQSLINKFSKAGSNAEADLGLVFNNIASNYFKLEDFDQAIQYYQQSLITKQNKYTEYNQEIAWVYNNIATCYLKDEDYDQAQDYFMKGRDYMLLMGVSEGKTISDSYSGLAKVSTAKQSIHYDLTQAKDYLNKAVKSISRTGSFEIPPNLSHIVDRQELIKLLPVKFNIVLLEYHDTKDIDVLSDAVEELRISYGLMDEYLSSYYSKKTQYQFLSSLNTFNKIAADILYIINNVLPDKTSVLNFLNTIESARSLILKEQLFKSRLRQLGVLSDEQFLQEKELKQSITDTRALMNSEPIDSLKAIYQKQLITLHNNLSELKGEIENIIHQDRDDRTDQPIDPHQLVSENEVLVYYQLGQDDLYSLILTKDSITINNLGRWEPIRSGIEWLNNAVYNPPTEDSYSIDAVGEYCNYASSLMEQLLPPIEMDKIIIIPDDALSTLPFAALTVGCEESTKRYNDLRFLVENNQILYEYSIDLMRSKTDDKRSFTTDYAGFSPFAGQDLAIGEDRYVQLPFSDDETSNFVSFFGGSVFTNDKATEAEVLQSVRESRILHLSTHGIASSSNSYLNSGFLLYNSADDTQNQSKLIRTYDVQSWDIQSELAILSACETATGNYISGEGLISLARAFRYAGTQNVVTPFWTADDYTTARIMSSFAKYLESGTSVSQSLSAAQNELIQNTKQPQAAHPYYWAGLISSGRDLELCDHSSPSYIYIVGFMMILLIGAYIYTKLSATR